MLDILALLREPKYQPIPVLPLQDRIIIMPIANKVFDLHTAVHGDVQFEETASGLLIPPQKEERIFGVVVAVGADIDIRDPNKVKPGDVVYYNVYAAGDLEMEGEIKKINVIELWGNEYRYIKERDVLAKYEFSSGLAETISVLGNRVLIQPDEMVTQIGNIIIPDDSQESPATATVVALGNELSPPFQHLAAGDRILFHKYGGAEVLVKERSVIKKFLALREFELMAVIED